jgi:hypothetical protein
MNFEHNSEKSIIIKSPLWDLLLSTNDCYPGCSCDDDFFDMTLNRVKKWVSNNDGTKVIQQIDNLLLDENIDIGEVQIQTNIPFQTIEEFREWLLEWKKLISESIL